MHEEPAGDVRLFIIAGEASGDKLGGDLLKNLHELYGNRLQLAGVGGPKMTQAGLSSLLPYERLGKIGVWQVVVNLVELARHFFYLLGALRRFQPQLLVIIDIPGFSLPFARFVRRLYRRDPAATPLIIQYSAPQVWGWRRGRARKYASMFDVCLALWPFEPAIFRKVGLDCRYVGHPATHHARTIHAIRADPQRYQQACDHLGLTDANGPVLIVLPGSRTREIRLHGEIFFRVIARLYHDWPNLIVLVPVLPHTKELVRKTIACNEALLHRHIRLIETPEDGAEAYAIADAALSKSGTATLELAASGVAMVIAYQFIRIESLILQMIASIPFIGLPNLLLRQQIAPEALGFNCRAELIEYHLNRLLRSSDLADRQRRAFQTMLKEMTIDPTDRPGSRAAQEIVACLNHRNKQPNP